jgi:hypothetical protein
MNLEARLQAVLGPQRSRQVREIAASFEGGDANVVAAFGQLTEVAPVERRPSGPRRAVVVPVSADDAVAGGGADLIRRTVAAVERHDSPDMQDKAKAVIAALRSIAPKTAIEGGLSGLFVAMERAAFDCLRLARLAGFDSPMGAVMLSRAEKLTCRATEVADAISRQRFRGQQTIRIEHVTVESGARAVIGNVATLGSRANGAG